MHFARKLFRPDTDYRNTTIFWLGASDADIEGIWKWVATDQQLNFQDWDVQNNQPTNLHDNHEDCLALSGAFDFKWHDGECDLDTGYALCEKQGALGSTGAGISAIG
ncbi:perlucin-like protein [Mya arenaria]|nr:perlucin-like protein [Mya arenaria]